MFIRVYLWLHSFFILQQSQARGESHGLAPHIFSTEQHPLTWRSTMTTHEIISLFDQWNEALASKDPKKVAALYETNAILLPTVSNKVRHNLEEIEEYFVGFLDKHPVGTIDESNVRVFSDIAIHSGIYTFRFSNGDEVQARFTFVYKWNGEAWKILEHHSSKMPE